MKLGEFIEQERTRRGWSQREAARRCQLSITRLQELETGFVRATMRPTSPTLDALTKVSRGLEIPLPRLMAIAGMGADEGSEQDEALVIQLWRGLTMENRAMARAILQAMTDQQTAASRSPD